MIGVGSICGCSRVFALDSIGDVAVLTSTTTMSFVREDVGDGPVFETLFVSTITSSQAVSGSGVTTSSGFGRGSPVSIIEGATTGGGTKTGDLERISESK